jgi:hypothetical protein
MSSVAQLIAFHGDQINHNIETNIGMRWSGHLGIRFAEKSNNIFGFSAKTHYESLDKINLLLDGTSFPGLVKDDYNGFSDAVKSPYGFTVLFYNVPNQSCTTNDCGLRQLEMEVENSPLTHKNYAYPPLAPRIYRNQNYSQCDSSWGHSCFNCATYVSSLGIQLFEHTGFFQYFIPEMSRQNTTFCRCYMNSQWVSSQLCVRDYQPSCFYEEPVEVECPFVISTQGNINSDTCTI